MQILGLCFSDTVAGVAARHDPGLVAASYFVAAFAAFTALDMTERLRKARPAARWFWRLGAALVLGAGVWSMHFVAMLAFRAPIQINYDPGLTLLSGAVAVAGVAAGLHILGAGGAKRIAGSGVLVGLSIAVMHYVGMGAMRLPGQLYYRPGLFALSIVIAMAAATAALWLAATVKTSWQRALAALVMAGAISGMHFTAMAATVLTAADVLVGEQAAGLVSGSLLAATIVASLSLILVFGLTCAYFDRRMEAREASEAERLRLVNESLEAKVQARTAELTGALAALDEQRLRAEAANRSKSEFLANMSHELRTPLNAVIGFAEILRIRRGRDALKPSQAEAVEQIASSGRHLLELIEEVLDFAKIESGKISVSLEAVDARATSQEILGGFRLQAERAGIALRCAGPTTPMAARADMLRLKQVLANLISNAIKYNRPGGRVSVALERRDGGVEISVRDTGMGIPAERMDDLFQPFERLGRETLAVEGAGLGLALTKRLVEAMHGELRVESVANKGSTFTVRLPSAPTAELRRPEPRPVQAVAAPEAPQAVVLYIEDNSSNIQLMRHIVDAIGGLDLHVADHPLKGLEEAARLQPDVILLDINLPDIDGFEVKVRLDANPATRQIPVIALSANVQADTLSRGRDVGFHSYMTKPLNIEALLGAIRSAVEQAPSADGRPFATASLAEAAERVRAARSGRNRASS
jgi:signal transduction histidine kinase/DNA-binding NarL/FixJ family response regulator